MNTHVQVQNQVGLNLRVKQLTNTSWLVSVHDHRNKTVLLDQLQPFRKSTSAHAQSYDDQGALYYVIAVLFMYALSIILMIGSLIKKSKQDNGMSKYMEDLDRVRKIERRQLKYKSRMAMHNNKRVARAIERRLSTASEPAPSPTPYGAAADGGVELEMHEMAELASGRAEIHSAPTCSSISSAGQDDDANSLVVSNNRPRALSDDPMLTKTRMDSLKQIQEEDEVFIV